MSNKKEREGSNSCQMLNKGKKLQNKNYIKNEDSCQDNNNKSLINKSYVNTS